MTEDALHAILYSSTNTPKEFLLTYLEMQLQKIQRTSIRDLQGELGTDIALAISGAIARQEWIDWESEPALSDVLYRTTPLEIEASDEGGWLALKLALEKALDL